MNKTYVWLAAAIVALAVILILPTLLWPPKVTSASAHVYNNPQTSLADIDLYVFYAVPKNQAPSDFAVIQSNLEKTLQEVSDFHNTQFLGRSLIHAKIFDRPVILREADSFYDTADTARGNPHALVSGTLELESRAFNPDGDLYDPTFAASTGPAAFRDIAIIYEGVGAAGTEGSLLLSRDFITRDEYALNRSALFYHEFGHSMGLPEGYDILTNAPYTNDIMGSGRREPLSTNYIDQKSLKLMGVF